MNKFLKSGILSLCLSFVGATSIQAQSQDTIVPFAPIGAEWWYSTDYGCDVCELKGINSYPIHFRAIKDTLIDSQICRMVVRLSETNVQEDTLFFHPHKTGVDRWDNGYWSQWYDTGWKKGDTVRHVVTENYDARNSFHEGFGEKFTTGDTVTQIVFSADIFKFGDSTLKTWSCLRLSSHTRFYQLIHIFNGLQSTLVQMIT